jgi:hypothetical protein
MSDDKPNDFEKADAERASMENGTLSVEPPSALLPSRRSNDLPVEDNHITELRQSLIEKYHGASGLIAKLERAGKIDAQSRLASLIDEVITETDHLLGNELIVTRNGELRDASIISFKRTEALEKAAKMVQAKMVSDKAGGDFDINAPEIATIFRFFLMKARDTLDHIGVNADMKDLFFRKFGELTEEWQKELKTVLNELPRVIP